MKQTFFYLLSMISIFTIPIYASPINTHSSQVFVASQASRSTQSDHELPAHSNGIKTLPPYGLPDAPLYGAIACFVIGLILIANQNRFRKNRQDRTDPS